MGDRESSEMDACIYLVGLHSAGQLTGKNCTIHLSSYLVLKMIFWACCKMIKYT